MPDLAQVTVTDCGIPAATRFPSSLYPRMPWYVKAWDNKIWLANGNVSNASPNANSGSGMVSYNPATETSTNEYTNSDEQIFTFREINGQLWAGGGDKDGGGDNQWLYKYASGSWSKYEVLPFGYHAYDLCQIGSTIYAGGGTESTCVAKFTWFKLTQMGAGAVTFSAGSGATLRSRGSKYKTAGQYAQMYGEVLNNSNGSSAEWVLAGDLTT